MTKIEEKKLIDSLNGDDSILVDGQAIFAPGADKFFSDFLTVLPKLKKVNLIIPDSAIRKLNEKVESLKTNEAKEKLIPTVNWVQAAVDNSNSNRSQVIIVGDPLGAFADKTILNQVQFLLPRHNVLLITQSEAMTKKARELRNPAIQNKFKLHCCRIKEDGTLGLYYFPTDKIN